MSHHHWHGGRRRVQNQRLVTNHGVRVGGHETVRALGIKVVDGAGLVGARKSHEEYAGLSSRRWSGHPQSRSDLA